MSIADIVKTWHILPNYAIAAQASTLATNQKILYDVFGDGGLFWGNGSWKTQANASASSSNNPVIRYSCNATTAGTPGDGVNRITTAAGITFNGSTARTWWVWDCPVIECEYMATCPTNGNGTSLTIAMAPYGATGSRFAGGTTTSNPATVNPAHQVTVLNNNSWGGVTTITSAKFHLWRSADGECFRIVGCSGGSPNTFHFYEKPESYDDAWNKQALGFAMGTSGGSSVITNNNLNATANIAAYANGGFNAALSMPFARNVVANAVTKTNGISNKWGMWPQHIESGTSQNDGYHGALRDVRWACPAPTLADGGISKAIVSPATPSGKWWKLGSLWLPGVTGIDCEVA